MAREERFEPWPWALAGLLGSMIALCLCFWWVAESYPDPVVPGYRWDAGAPGIEPDPRAATDVSSGEAARGGDLRP